MSQVIREPTVGPAISAFTHRDEEPDRGSVGRSTIVQQEVRKKEDVL